MKFDRVAVTGGSGRLGRYVVEELAGHAEVTVLDIAPPAGDHAYVALDVRDLDAGSGGKSLQDEIGTYTGE